jgi:hypothetical protein
MTDVSPQAMQDESQSNDQVPALLNAPDEDILVCARAPPAEPPAAPPAAPDEPAAAPRAADLRPTVGAKAQVINERHAAARSASLALQPTISNDAATPAMPPTNAPASAPPAPPAPPPDVPFANVKVLPAVPAARKAKPQAPAPKQQKGGKTQPKKKPKANAAPRPSDSSDEEPSESGDESDGDEQEEETFQVECILGHQGDGKKRKYLLKWEGYPESEATYEPASNIDPDMIKLYNASIAPQQEKQPKPKAANNPKPAPKTTVCAALPHATSVVPITHSLLLCATGASADAREGGRHA